MFGDACRGCDRTLRVAWGCPGTGAIRGRSSGGCATPQMVGVATNGDGVAEGLVGRAPWCVALRWGSTVMWYAGDRVADVVPTSSPGAR